MYLLYISVTDEPAVIALSLQFRRYWLDYSPEDDDTLRGEVIDAVSGS